MGGRPRRANGEEACSTGDETVIVHGDVDWLWPTIVKELLGCILGSSNLLWTLPSWIGGVSDVWALLECFAVYDDWLSVLFLGIVVSFIRPFVAWNSKPPCSELVVLQCCLSSVVHLTHLFEVANHGTSESVIWYVTVFFKLVPCCLAILK